MNLSTPKKCFEKRFGKHFLNQPPTSPPPPIVSPFLKEINQKVARGLSESNNWPAIISVLSTFKGSRQVNSLGSEWM